MQLEILRLDIRKNDDVVGVQNLFIAAGLEIIEIPSGHAGDFELAAGLDGLKQPMAIVDEVQALGGVVKRSLGINGSELDRPIADVINAFHESDVWLSTLVHAWETAMA